jgi:hypothetical protein
MDHISDLPAFPETWSHTMRKVLVLHDKSLRRMVKEDLEWKPCRL